jgi:hypothetical protein
MLDGPHEVEEPGERQLRLDLQRARPQVQERSANAVGDVLQQRRLPDARLAVEDQRRARAPEGSAVDQPLELSDLGRSSEQRHWMPASRRAASSMTPSRLQNAKRK